VQKKIMKQMQKRMQDSLSRIQDELGAQEVEGLAQGGLVKIRMNGAQEVLGVRIDPSVVNPEEVDLLEDLILIAIKDAVQKVQELSAEQVAKLTGNLKIPGLF
jgi:DNA-binding YbaB/EbfC family protein